MWNTFIYKDVTYVIKNVQTQCYEIILSDFVKIWIESLTSKQLVERCKELNPTFRTDNDTYTKTVLSLLETDLNENNVVISEVEETLDFECKTKLVNATFKFVFHLKLSDNLAYCKEIAVPMIQTIQILEQQQKYLCDLLVKKDKEVYQHEFENGSIKRGDVVTEKFDEESFVQGLSKNLCHNIFNKSEDFSKILIEKYGCLEPKLLQVKKEEKKVKNKGDLAKKILRYKKPKLSSNE